MEALTYYDGKIATPEELTVPFNDRVHFFGDGVYDATVGANGKVYLLPSVVAAQHAKRTGVQETVLHRGDIVTECAHSNVSILKDGVYYSHPNDEFILRGIAKTHMIAACYRLGITVMEKCFTLDDLKNADEILVTSSSNFCLHACEVDGQPAGGKDPATLKAIQDEVLREYFAYTGKTTVVRG